MSFDQYCKNSERKSILGSEYVISVNGKWGVVTLEIEDIPFLLERLDALDSSNPQVLAHLKNYNNPHNVTPKQLGLENVDNTADLDKPISTLVKARFEGLERDIENTTKRVEEIFSFDEAKQEFYINFEMQDKKYKFTFGPGYYGLEEN